MGPQPPEYVELDPAISPLDDTNNGGEGSGGDASDADYLTLCQDARRLSPLDPSCPGTYDIIRMM